jgi:hypothetical protein
MTHWAQTNEAAHDMAGFVQWYLCDMSSPIGNSIVGEVVCINNELGTYYADLSMGKGLRYFTDVEDAKAYLWTLYALEKAS